MPFNNIDSPGNRHDRRCVAAVQRSMGKEGRIAAAEAKRQRRMAKAFKKDLDRTINFYAMPTRGYVASDDPEGAYIGKQIDGTIQVIVVGTPKLAFEDYATAVGCFMKKEVKLVSDISMPAPNDRLFRSLIIEVV